MNEWRDLGSAFNSRSKAFICMQWWRNLGWQFMFHLANSTFLQMKDLQCIFFEQAFQFLLMFWSPHFSFIENTMDLPRLGYMFIKGGGFIIFGFGNLKAQIRKAFQGRFFFCFREFLNQPKQKKVKSWTLGSKTKGRLWQTGRKAGWGDQSAKKKKVPESDSTLRGLRFQNPYLFQLVHLTWHDKSCHFVAGDWGGGLKRRIMRGRNACWKGLQQRLKGKNLSRNMHNPNEFCSQLQKWVGFSHIPHSPLSKTAHQGIRSKLTL